MTNHAVTEWFNELVTLVFLSAGPALGAAVGALFLGGLIWGVVVILTR